MMSIPLDSFVPVLVEMMTMEYMPDIMLLAARALTTMADVIPPSRGAIVHHGALPLFCSRLLTIEYIDLAEQSLQALEKLSQDYGAECARQGALTACLSYLDFFSRHAARELANRRQHLSTASELHFRRRHGRRAHPGQSLGARRSASRGLFVRVLPIWRPRWPRTPRARRRVVPERSRRQGDGSHLRVVESHGESADASRAYQALERVHEAQPGRGARASSRKFARDLIRRLVSMQGSHHRERRSVVGVARE